MTWFKVDDDLAFHRKVVAAGNAAMGLWVRAGAWCAQHLTDGFVPEEMVGILGTTSQRSKLIKVGLWIEVDGGVRFHEWNENGRQPLAKKVRERRAAAADRQAKHRTTIYKNLQADESSNGVTNASRDAHVTPFVTPPPTRPDPSISSDEEIKTPPPAAGRQQTAFDVAPRRAGQDTNASDVVAVWHDAFVVNGTKPTRGQIGQVGREAKQLLEAGNDPRALVVAAQSLGGKGMATLIRELQIQTQRPVQKQQRRTTDDKRADISGLVAEVYGTAGSSALRPDTRPDHLRAIQGGNS